MQVCLVVFRSVNLVPDHCTMLHAPREPRDTSLLTTGVYLPVCQEVVGHSSGQSGEKDLFSISTLLVDELTKDLQLGGCVLLGDLLESLMFLSYASRNVGITSTVVAVKPLCLTCCCNASLRLGFSTTL